MDETWESDRDMIYQYTWTSEPNAYHLYIYSSPVKSIAAF